MAEEERTLTRLEQLGLSITHRQAPASGWGYRWRGGDWEGPYQTQTAAVEAAFSKAIDTLILYKHCPFPRGDCPLMRSPLLSRFEADMGRDEEEEERPRWRDEDWES